MAQTDTPARVLKDAAANEAMLAEQARTAELDAKQALERAEVAERQAKEALAGLREQIRTERLRGKPDSCPKGTVNLMPELKLSDEDLVARVGTGELDGALSELLELARAHPRLKPDGTFAERQLVISALETRIKRG